jgi:hypothetical protein
MSEIHGRGGRVIVVDESLAKPLNTVMNDIRHRRDLDATQPMEPVVLPRVSRRERFYDRLEVWGARVGIAVLLLGLLALAVLAVMPRG